MSKNLAINRCLEDLEFLISRWTVESHTFIEAWGQFCPTLEDVIVLTGLSLWRSRAITMLEDSDKVALGARG